MARPSPPTRAVLRLARTDQESTGDASGMFPSTDWLDESLTLRAAYTGALIRGMRYLRLGHLLRDRLSASYAPLARQRLRRGCRLLAAASLVITDRLHGHILCVLLGIPHLLLDNSYGKVRAFYETWTAGWDGVQWCGSAREALAKAADMARPGQVEQTRSRTPDIPCPRASG